MLACLLPSWQLTSMLFYQQLSLFRYRLGRWYTDFFLSSVLQCLHYKIFFFTKSPCAYKAQVMDSLWRTPKGWLLVLRHIVCSISEKKLVIGHPSYLLKEMHRLWQLDIVTFIKNILFYLCLLLNITVKVFLFYSSGDYELYSLE